MQTTATFLAAPRVAFGAARPIIVRSLWKEYRMLRGFWCGVAALALLEMYVVRTLTRQGEGAALLFGSAWAAAALYAVGAAITLFAVEREEQTDAFLRLLPRRSWGLLVGKVLAAAATAFLLAGVLLLFALPWPAARDAADLSAVGAVGVLQFLAWGVFMSLACPQPLLAAVLAIAAASFGMQLAVAAASQTGAGVTLAEYRDAAGLQLILALAVGVVDAWLGRRWLEPRERRSRWRRLEWRESTVIGAVPSAASTARSSAAFPMPRRRILGRLLWQTWREGWKPMLAAAPVGLFMIVADSAAMSLFAERGSLGAPLVSTWLAIPALWGALVFRADQRGQRYRFLSEHGAPPRLVWAARQAVWLMPLVVGFVVLQIVVRTVWSMYVDQGVVSALAPGESVWIFEHARENPAQTALVFDYLSRSLGRWTVLAWCGALAAYGAGQLCSMLVRSPVLAGFAAILLAAAINWWTILAGFWRLPAWLFVAPIGVAALAASFVSCRRWLADRRGRGFWLTSTGIVALGLALIALAVPVVREGQVPRDQRVGPFARQTLEEILTQWHVDDASARAVAIGYEDLAARLTAAVNAASVVKSESSLAEPAGGRAPGEPDEAIASLPEAGGFERGTPQRGWWADYPAEAFEASQDLLAEAAELSRAPRCRFPEWNPAGGRLNPTSGAFGTFVALILIDAERHLENGDLDAALERILTLRRIEGHLQQYQPIAAQRFLRFAGPSGDANGLLLRWATAAGQTSERVLRAIEGLQDAESRFPAFSDSIVANYEAVRSIVRGASMPTFLNQQNGRRRLRLSSRASTPTFLKQQNGQSGQLGWTEWFATLSNELPWERRRALTALDFMANVQLEFGDAMISGFTRANDSAAWPHELAAPLRKRLLASNVSNELGGPAGLPSPAAYATFLPWTPIRRQQELIESAQTSLLPALELGNRGYLPVELRTYLSHLVRRALERIALGLIAYRLDHGELPESLRDLVPEYAPHGVALDPFTLTMFEYRPHGLDLPLATVEMTGQSQLIPGGTPLLWSASSGFVELREQWGHVSSRRDMPLSGQWFNAQYDADMHHAVDRYAPAPLHVQRLVPTALYMPDDSAIVLAIPEANRAQPSDE